MDGVSTTADPAERPGFDPVEIRTMIDQVPKHGNYKLTPHQGSMQVTVMPDAWRGGDRTEDDPGRVDQFYFEEHDLLVLDLSR